jgi:hypothetical protein
VRTKDVIQGEIGSALLQTGQLVGGEITDFDPVRQRVTVVTDSGGPGVRTFTNLSWPSGGMGTRLGPPRNRQKVILGFLDGNLAAPVILSLLSGSGLGVEGQPDLSSIRAGGRLRLLRNLS